MAEEQKTGALNPQTHSLDYVPVVLAGGSGSRLWPLSRTDYPKQFLSLNGPESPLQQTLLRAVATTARTPIVMCAEKHRFLTAEQIQALPGCEAEIVLEPSVRDTAPAIAAAAWHACRQDNDAVLAIMPADHCIPDTEAFCTALASALEAARTGQLVTLGITPTRAETGYGYIETDGAVASDTAPLSVTRFIEKPPADQAQALLDSARCYWNAGIVIVRAATFLDLLQDLQPGIHTATREAVELAVADLDFIRLDANAFNAAACISVDYAVLEHARNVVMVPFTSEWSDIGSWDAVHDISPTDVYGNAAVGDVLHHNSKRTFTHASSRLVVTIGTQNLSIIETSDVVLILDNDHAQSIKDVVENLRREGRPEIDSHTTVYRPWGHYQVLNLNPRFQVKRIAVKPGASLSLQKHYHRSEHWVVVSGTATVTVGDDKIMLTENQSTYIPVGTLHRLHNPGSITLELIEVQSGSYLGEDDILRVGDDYGRN